MWKTDKDKGMLVTKCRSREEKERIMENKKKLGTERIYINNGLT